MSDFLSYRFEDTPETASTFDEAPLWSAAFGLLLLRHLEMKPAMTVIDCGSGTGFPLLELAGRLGNSSKLYGIDPWVNANARARQKIKSYGLTNVEIMDASAAQIPLPDETADLVVSNLGINNFENPPAVFRECCRVLRPGGKLALTTNLNGHWDVFYVIFEKVLQQLGKTDELAALRKQQEHRGTIESLAALFSENGFRVTRFADDELLMNFADGTAFLNHYFVKLGWMSSWRDLIAEKDREAVFSLLEKQLNTYAAAFGSLKLTVPMAFMEGEKMMQA